MGLKGDHTPLTKRQTLRRLGEICVIALCVASYGFCNTALANEGTEKMVDATIIEELSQLSGDEYLTLRNQVVAEEFVLPPQKEALSAGQDWRLDMTYSILEGWSQNKSFYSELTEEIENLDFEGQSRKVSGTIGLIKRYELLSREIFGPKVLPLAWEFVTKLSDLKPEEQHLVHLALISGHQDARSIEPLIHLIKSNDNGLIRESAVSTLSRQPMDPVLGHLRGLAEETTGADEALNFIRDRLKF